MKRYVTFGRGLVVNEPKCWEIQIFFLVWFGEWVKQLCSRCVCEREKRRPIEEYHVGCGENVNWDFETEDSFSSNLIFYS